MKKLRDIFKLLKNHKTPEELPEDDTTEVTDSNIESDDFEDDEFEDDESNIFLRIWHVIISLNRFWLAAGIIIITTVSALCFNSLALKIILLVEIVACLAFWLYLIYEPDDDDEDVETIQFDQVEDGVTFIPADDNGIKLSDLALQDPVKELSDLLEFVKEPSSFDEAGYYPESKVLLVGEKGSGKETFIKAFANEANIPILRIHASRFFSTKNLTDKLFKLANCADAYIIQIDFFEKICASASNGDTVITGDIIIDNLIQYCEAYPNVVLFATCEDLEGISDENIISHFFKKIIVMESPDFDERIKLLKKFTANANIDETIDFSAIAKSYDGASIGEIKYMVQTAISLAHKDNRKELTQEDFFNAMDSAVDHGISSKKHSKESQKIVAYHEAGHAIANYVLSGKESILRVISTSRGSAGGYTLHSINEDQVVTPQIELLNRVCVCYGGRCAEKLIFNHLSTGASADIQTATSTILSMVQRYGMSDAIGPINVSPKIALLSVINESDEMRNLISKECARIAKECEKRTMDLLTQNRKKLDTLANYLIEHESITGAELNELLENISE